MVELAKNARKRNTTTHEILEQAITKKMTLIHNGSIQYDTMCADNQFIKEFYHLVFSSITFPPDDVLDQSIPTNEDITTGFMLFSAVLYCPEPVLKLYQFLHNLLSYHSPRTIIQAVVNTIESNDVKDLENRENINQLYLALDQIFNFQYGKILLALSAPSELRSMQSQGWPYFTHFSKEMDECLNDSSWQGVTDLINSVGEQPNHHLSGIDQLGKYAQIISRSLSFHGDLVSI